MSGHVVESTRELSVFMKANAMAGSERDTGFSSCEDDMSGLHSPSASEDSVEVQVTRISLRNKRKLAEPRKIQEPSTAPLKKRRFNQVEQIEEAIGADEESAESRRAESATSPFRPWSNSSKSNDESKTSSSRLLGAATSPSSDHTDRVWSKASIEEEPRIQEGFPPRLEDRAESPAEPSPQKCLDQRRDFMLPPRLQEEPLSLVLRGELPRVPSHPAVSGGGYAPSTSSVPSYSIEQTNHSSSSTGESSSHQNHHHRSAVSSQQQSHLSNSRQHQAPGGQQRNYKNMTRERRIEANARERTRVHTISAAFDTLRRAIPAYSHNQKLSKLSVLRIACSYIMTLGKIVNTPEGQSANGPSLGACVDLVSRTIQTEGKLRKRKED